MSTLLTADAAALLFLTPDRAALPDESDSGPPLHSMLSTPGGRIATWRQGEGPAVLTVHGWSGNHADMVAFVAPLVAAGCMIVSIDLPAHGQSEGEIASIPDMAEAIRAVATAIGPLRGVIAHSVGCAAMVLALKQGMQVLRAVLVAPPARYAHFARAFSKHVGVDPDDLLAALRRRDVDVQSVDLPLMAASLSARALILHSRDDQVVPFANGRALAAAWPGSRFVECEELGHKRILSDSMAVNAVVSFLIDQ